jgi:hypothetical protein
MDNYYYKYLKYKRKYLIQQGSGEFDIVTRKSLISNLKNKGHDRTTILNNAQLFEKPDVVILKQAGYSATNFKSVGSSALVLKNIGFNASELKK